MAKEMKRSLTYSGYASTKKKVTAKAKKEGRTFSEIAEALFKLYIDAPVWKGVSDGKPVPTFPLPTEVIDKL